MCKEGARVTGYECRVADDGLLYADSSVGAIIDGRFAGHLEILGRPLLEGRVDRRGGGTDVGNVPCVVSFPNSLRFGG